MTLSEKSFLVAIILVAPHTSPSVALVIAGLALILAGWVSGRSK